MKREEIATELQKVALLIDQDNDIAVEMEQLRQGMLSPQDSAETNDTTSWSPATMIEWFRENNPPRDIYMDTRTEADHIILMYCHITGESRYLLDELLDKPDLPNVVRWAIKAKDAIDGFNEFVSAMYEGLPKAVHEDLKWKYQLVDSDTHDRWMSVHSNNIRQLRAVTGYHMRHTLSPQVLARYYIHLIRDSVGDPAQHLRGLQVQLKRIQEGE